MAKILIVEDDNNLAKILNYHLSEEGHLTVVARDGEEAMKLLDESQFEVILTDIKMPRMDGMEFIRKVKEAGRETPIVAMTAYGTIEDAVAAMKEGAEDYLTKPVSRETLLIAVEKACKMRALLLENVALKETLKERSALKNILGNSEKLVNFLESLKRVAKTDATVLLLGESGTGKELAARALHEISLRTTGPFVPLNCAAIPRELLESELFGHEKGAFTGAVQSKKGKVEMADKGTLFLDEIGDMDLSLQSKILRLLETKVVEPVGSRDTKKVDFRLVAATHRDLKAMAEEGKFRNDLYYRLTVVPMDLPPLRERKSDIPLLLNHFYKIYGGGEIRVTSEALDYLLKYNWYGNIRELENLCQRWAILNKGEKITLEKLPREIVDKVEAFKEGEESLWEVEKKTIVQALEKAEGNVSKAARELKIHRHVLLYRMKKWDIKADLNS